MYRVMLVGLALMSAACSSTGAIDIRMPITTDLGRYETISGDTVKSCVRNPDLIDHAATLMPSLN